MDDKNKLYSVTELSREFNITPRTVRFYGEKGLLSTRRAGKTLVFNFRDKARLTLILRLKRVGFDLTEIKEYIDLYNTDATGVSQLTMGYQSLSRRIGELKGQLKDLRLTLKELEKLKKENAELLSEKGIDIDNLRI